MVPIDCSILVLGWTDEDAPDEDRLRELGDEIREIIYSVHGKFYSNQKSIGLYPTTGSADDWFYSDSANTENGEFRSASYTMELRDTGSQGFLLDPSQVSNNNGQLFHYSGTSV